MVKSRKFQDLLKEELKNPEIKKEYENLREEFELANRIIELRKGRADTGGTGEKNPYFPAFNCPSGIR